MRKFGRGNWKDILNDNQSAFKEGRTSGDLNNKHRSILNRNRTIHNEDRIGLSDGEDIIDDANSGNATSASDAEVENVEDGREQQNKTSEDNTDNAA